MAGQVVQMDYEAIQRVSQGFTTAKETLTRVGQILEVLINVLRATAFFSFGTSAALAQYLDVIKQKVQKLAKICEEFAGDLARAISDHKNGDFQGKRYFGEGIRR